MSTQDSEKNKRLHETIADLGQPVSLADELRKLGEKWEHDTIIDGPHGKQYEKHSADCRRCELSALLAQHAVAEPQKWTCPDCGYDSMPYPPKDYHICPKCMVEFGVDDRKSWHIASQQQPQTANNFAAHAAEQPKLTGLKYFPLPWHPDEGEPEGAQVYDANNHAVLMLFWPGHPVEETETVERETYALMRLIAKLVNEHFALLTSPVAPPPQMICKNCGKAIEPCFEGKHCGFSGWNHGGNTHYCTDDFGSVAEPPVATGEQPPRTPMTESELGLSGVISTEADAKDGADTGSCRQQSVDSPSPSENPLIMRSYRAWVSGAQKVYDEFLEIRATAAKLAREEALEEAAQYFRNCGEAKYSGTVIGEILHGWSKLAAQPSPQDRT